METTLSISTENDCGVSMEDEPKKKREKKIKLDNIIGIMIK